AGGAHEADEVRHVARAVVPALAEPQLLDRHRRSAAREKKERVRSLHAEVFVAVRAAPAAVVLLRADEVPGALVEPSVRAELRQPTRLPDALVPEQHVMNPLPASR